jgi:phospholipase/lecithinase/hemolysin
MSDNLSATALTPTSGRSRVGRSCYAAALSLGALAAAPAVQAAPQLTVFGDSYSVPVHDGFRDWPVQLREQGIVGQVRDFAHSGATASSRWHINFAQQIDAWRRAGRPLGLTVVYLGYNDIGGDTASSRAGYLAGVQALVDAGAASGGDRLYLVQPHDIGSTPLYDHTSQRSTLRRDTMAWDTFVASTAHRFHATEVNVFGTIDTVLRDPRRYGFTNVTTADRAHAATTALYADSFHFGQHGQALIARTIGSRLR